MLGLSLLCYLSSVLGVHKDVLSVGQWCLFTSAPFLINNKSSHLTLPSSPIHHSPLSPFHFSHSCFPLSVSSNISQTGMPVPDPHAFILCVVSMCRFWLAIFLHSEANYSGRHGSILKHQGLDLENQYGRRGSRQNLPKLLLLVLPLCLLGYDFSGKALTNCSFALSEFGAKAFCIGEGEGPRGGVGWGMVEGRMMVDSEIWCSGWNWA